MAIEFHCLKCGTLLRTPDDTAGQQAQCPACGTVMGIPEAPSASSFSTGDSRFSGEAYRAEPSMPPPEIVLAVSGPAIALIVTAWIGIVLNAIAIVVTLFVAGAHIAFRPLQANQIVGQELQIGGGVLQLAMGLFVLIGATKMKNLEAYSLAMTAAIIAMVPCVSPCCLLGLPFGIWAIMVLSDHSVKSAFRS